MQQLNNLTRNPFYPKLELLTAQLAILAIL